MRGSIAGLPDTIEQGSSTYYTFLTALDFLFSSVVVAPCVVGYWRSIWGISDLYIAPKNEKLSAIISIVIGIVGNILFALFQKKLEQYFHPDRSRVVFYVVSRFYTGCFGFVCVNSWRGPWQMLNLYAKSEFIPALATTTIGIVALMAIRALRNISSAPFAVATDSVKGYFEVLTMFRMSIGKKTSLYILDCLFSVLVVGTLVVFVWRGAWILLDILLFPEDFTGSSWASLIIGYVAVAIAFVIQPLMRWICDRLTGIARLIVADLFILFSFFGTVNVWRGIWNLLNIYFLPDNFELSCWITHWVSLVVLILLGCSNSLLIRGVYIDAEEPAGKCVVFPCYYLRIIFQQEKIKKLNAKQVLANQKINLSEKEERSEKLSLENNHMHCIDLKSELSENHK